MFVQLILHILSFSDTSTKGYNFILDEDASNTISLHFPSRGSIYVSVASDFTLAPVTMELVSKPDESAKNSGNPGISIKSMLYPHSMNERSIHSSLPAGAYTLRLKINGDRVSDCAPVHLVRSFHRYIGLFQVVRPS